MTVNVYMNVCCVPERPYLTLCILCVHVDVCNGLSLTTIIDS